jgi:hypothetical protein
VILKLNLKLRERPHDHRFEEAAADPATAQRDVLRDLVSRNAQTAFGREHGFASIRGPEDYRRLVPIRDYEAFRPYVKRIDAGETAVLTADPVNLFTTTSGTTGEPKLIPVTTPWREKMASLMRLWYYRAMRQHPAMFDRKALSIVSPAIEGHTAGGIPFGAMSGVVFKRTPWVVRNHYAIPYEVSLIQDYEARYFVTMRLALAQSVSCLGTPNPTSLLRLAETGASKAEAIIRAIRDGTLGIPDPPLLAGSGRLPEQILGVIGKRLEADPDRARELERLVERHGSLLPRDAWPDLKLVACWLGGSAGIHAKRLAQFYGEAPLRDLGLIASEGRMTIPLADGTAAGALAIHANFYEFIPEDEIEAELPPVLLAHELEAGKRYYIVLTTGNGLCRYDMNDIVDVQGFHHRTPLVAFVRKGRDMVSITGEKLHLNQIQAAVHEAEAAIGRHVWQFRLIPSTEQCVYDLLVEFGEPQLSEAETARFMAAYDAALMRLNDEFKGKRKSGRLEPTRLHAMRTGWSERLCVAEFKAGKREHQYKWQVLRPEWDDASRREVIALVANPG